MFYSLEIVGGHATHIGREFPSDWEAVLGAWGIIRDHGATKVSVKRASDREPFVVLTVPS